MRGVSGHFGLGTFAGFLVSNTAGVSLMALFDRWFGVSAAIRFSIVVVIVLSALAAWFFSVGERTDRTVAEWRALLLGLVVSAGYWTLVMITSALLALFTIPLPTAVAALPFLAICALAPKVISVRK